MDEVGVNNEGIYEERKLYRRYCEVSSLYRIVFERAFESKFFPFDLSLILKSWF